MNRQQSGRHLLPVAIGSAIGALGLAGSTATSLIAVPAGAKLILAAAKVVGQLVSGLALNYASGFIAPLLDSVTTPEGKSNHDLDRITTLALLTILHGTLTEHGIEPDEVIRGSAEAWNLRIFRDVADSPAELVDLLRAPRRLDEDHTVAIARMMLPSGLAHLQSAFGAAIANRFAQTFELLLHSDERAFRAAIIYLQRLELEDLARVRSDVARILDLLLRPQPTLERYEALRKPLAEPVEITDLQFKRRATAYRPRPSLMSSLRDWLLSPDPFRILKLTGPAGMGKSRLAVELCDWCDRELWLSGFVTSAGWPAVWTPNRDTLAAVDYAAFKSISGQSAFQWLETIFLRVRKLAATTDRFPRVRIVLIDRTDGGPLWLDWRFSETSRDLDHCSLAVSLEPDRSEFDAIVADELRRRTQRELSRDESQAIAGVADRLRGQFRPLFALLTAAAVADHSNLPSVAWSPELLIENVLKGQLRQWSVAGVRDEQLDLLLEATLTRGACNSDPAFVRRVESLSPSTLTALTTLSDPGLGMGGISPDVLGEFFVLMCLRGELSLSTRQSHLNVREARQILERSWLHDSMGAFVGRLLEDYLPWKPQSGVSPAVEMMHAALAETAAGSNNAGLPYCCFAAAWKCPWDVNWGSWLLQIPLARRTSVFVVMGHDISP